MGMGVGMGMGRRREVAKNAKLDAKKREKNRKKRHEEEGKEAKSRRACFSTPCMRTQLPYDQVSPIPMSGRPIA